MPVRSAIVIVVDGLGAGALGPYGNTWIETRAANRLASQSIVVEQMITDSPRPETVCRSYWQGLHALMPDEDNGRSLTEQLNEAGVESILVTDDPAIAAHPLAQGFAERVRVPVSEQPTAATEIHQTQFAQVLASADNVLNRVGEPFLVWVHARGMYAPWDAPQSMREQMADEEDPLPPAFTEVPCTHLPENYDPDELLSLMQAYAGQVALWDACLAAFLAGQSEDPISGDVALMLTSTRGFPLGEHLRVGAFDDALYTELVHIPWIARFPAERGAACRAQTLAQPADLFATLLDWFKLDTAAFATGRSILSWASGETKVLRDRASAAAEGELALRTPAWYFRRSDPPELFVKPDDRWDANEISDRCRDVVGELKREAANFEAAAATGDLDGLAPLSPLLREGLG
jgi:arylsulfatase A-like enzyme